MVTICCKFTARFSSTSSASATNVESQQQQHRYTAVAS